MKKVMAFGVFDIFHKGHEHFLKKCASKGDLIVVVARDSTVLKVKKKKTEKNERSRLAKISRLDYVDKAVLGDRKDFFRAIRNFRPDIICLGYDQKIFTDNMKQVLRSEKIAAKTVRIGPYRPDIYKSSLIKK